MAKGELKYWVFEQDKLEERLVAHAEARVAQGTTEALAVAEVEVIRAFLLSPTALPLRGGRAG